MKFQLFLPPHLIKNYTFRKNLHGFNWYNLDDNDWVLSRIINWRDIEIQTIDMIRIRNHHGQVLDFPSQRLELHRDLSHMFLEFAFILNHYLCIFKDYSRVSHHQGFDLNYVISF